MDQDGRYAAMEFEGNPTLGSWLSSLDDDLNLPEGVAAIAFRILDGARKRQAANWDKSERVSTFPPE